MVRKLSVEELERKREEAVERVDSYCDWCDEKLEGDYVEEEIEEDHLEKGYRRYHKDCYRKLEEEREEYRKKREEMKEKKEEIERKKEEGEISFLLPPLHMNFYGKKPDFEKFKEAVKELAKEYDLSLRIEKGLTDEDVSLDEDKYSSKEEKRLMKDLERDREEGEVD